MVKVAALFVERGGVYYEPGLDVDCWDEARNAKAYDAPYPVVAHPPCGPWGSLKHLSRLQDPTCGPIAVAIVRAMGGVLEHPQRSSLFAHCGMPRPGETPDACGGFTIQVDQVDWGHVARKRTWLYVVAGVVPNERPEPREPTHWVSGTRKRQHGSKGGVIPPGIKACSSQQRRRTPPAFRDFLLAIARSVTRPAPSAARSPAPPAS